MTIHSALEKLITICGGFLLGVALGGVLGRDQWMCGLACGLGVAAGMCVAYLVQAVRAMRRLKDD